MSIIARQITVETGSQDEEGVLVFHDGRLIACLIRLSEELHGGDGGKWFVETMFLRDGKPPDTKYPDLESAIAGVTLHATGEELQLSEPVRALDL